MEITTSVVVVLSSTIKTAQSHNPRQYLVRREGSQIFKVCGKTQGMEITTSGVVLSE